MTKHLRDLFKDFPLKIIQMPQSGDVQVSGIAFDSRKVQPGDLFIPLTGVFQDGHTYIPAAIRNGAAAVVGSDPNIHIDLPYIQVEDTRLALAFISAAFYDYPARKLTMIGVTGTDGKTTTCNLLFSILKAAGIKAGMISTVNAVIGDDILDTGFHVTTPDAPDVQRYLAEMVSSGLTHAILETTSHGLAQDRVAACEFDIGVVTNITHEHLDFHGSYENYFQAKAKLFTGLNLTRSKPQGNPRLAVLNYDDQSYYPLRNICKVRNTSYSVAGKSADLHAANLKETSEGMEFGIIGQGINVTIRTCLKGDYNVSNILAAFAAAVFGLNITPQKAADGIALMSGVPGRMEKIDIGQDFCAIVDFAHTPNALTVALQQARSMCEGRLIAVFGSAGLRDREKRRMMAEVSVGLANITILTAEDPRTESLDVILSEMADAAKRKGAQVGNNLFITPDRAEAIRKAVSMAEPGDMVIALGKGHEQSMCFGDKEYPWDDRIAMRAAIAGRLGIAGEKMPWLPTQENS